MSSIEICIPAVPCGRQQADGGNIPRFTYAERWRRDVARLDMPG
jgi:hypothetical protein